MKNVPYLSHISKDGREQTVLEHLTGTAELCADFASAFDAREQGQLAGMAHDLGKYSDAFQHRLKGGPRVDHSTAGAYECFTRGQILAAFAVMGHHGKGLPDGGGQTDPPDAPTFWARIARAQRGLLPPYDHWKEEVVLPVPKPAPLPPKGGAELMADLRMLHSCLVDADFLDTEAFMAGHSREGTHVTMADLEELLHRHIAGWFPPKGELNQQRCAILERCQAQGETQAPGLFTLTVPTGSGKTVASLAFALRHARAHGLRRVIYVIPYTSIIEQTAKTFRDILGEENVLEHHSNVLYDLEGEADPKTVHLAQATENWDMPVVVTTAVQFFESLYACRPSQCRKLHNIAGSVVIFDEAQMLPLPYLRPCVHAMAQLVKNFHVSAVLCTATQPALEPVFREFLPGQATVELCPPETCRWEVFRRTAFRQGGDLSWEELAQALNGHAQVLCIVNTRKGAQEVFSRLDREGSFHLSTLMYPAHRAELLEEIKWRLDKGLPCRVVSTSLIEAGVDVDFPAVYREAAGLDSILQAAGRCNREGRESAEKSIVTIFHGEGNPPALLSTNISVGQLVMDRQKDLSSQTAIHDYFRELLDLKGRAAQDKKGLLPLCEGTFFPFRQVAQEFRLIDTPTRTLYIPHGKGEELVGRLRAGERSRDLFRKLGRYGVSVYEKHLKALDQAGALELLEDGSAILTDLSLYREATGLEATVETGLAHFA